MTGISKKSTDLVTNKEIAEMLEEMV